MHGVSYYIHPLIGGDEQDGRAPETPWRSFAPLARRELGPGDRVVVLAPGPLHASLHLRGAGTAAAPITVTFAPGDYPIADTDALTRRYHISNCNDAWDEDKAIALLLDHVRHLRLAGAGARIICHGKLIELCLDHCRDVTIAGLSYDYARPTVSEFRVAGRRGEIAELQVHPDSRYALDGDRLVWQGPGWDYRHEQGLLAQRLSPDRTRLQRCPDPLAQATVTEAAPGRLQVRGATDLAAGETYQLRTGRRDCVGLLIHHGGDITLRDLRLCFMHGMGVLAQSVETLTLERVVIAPAAASGRSCAAWADCFHASGCRGRITVHDCRFDGAQDDAINVHGTHLQIQEATGPRELRLRFMHRQTFGLEAFRVGDVVDLVRADSLAPYATAQVRALTVEDPWSLRLTLAEPLPPDWRPGDAVENVSWTPAVTIEGCRVQRIPTRGFLLTTRQPVLVAGNLISRTQMPGILVEDDASGWYESGCVRDMTIVGNTFVSCGRAGVRVNPQTRVRNDAVHRHIRIRDNDFELDAGCAVEARGVAGLQVRGNRVSLPSPVDRDAAVATPFRLEHCRDHRLADNTLSYRAP